MLSNLIISKDIYKLDMNTRARNAHHMHRLLRLVLDVLPTNALTCRRQRVQCAALRLCERRGLHQMLQHAPVAGFYGVLIDAVHEHDKQHVSGRQRRPSGLLLGWHHVPRGHCVVGNRLRSRHPGRKHIREHIHR